MRTKTRTEITFEKIQRTTIRLNHPRLDWCGQCGAETTMVTAERAAALMQAPAREIYRRAEEGELHFVETNATELLICVASLAAGAMVSLPTSRAEPASKTTGCSQTSLILPSLRTETYSEKTTNHRRKR